MSTLHKFATAALRCLPAETAHGFALRSLSAGLGPRAASNDQPALAQSLMGMTFDNPVAISAGFDKNAVAIAGVRDIGVGFVEVGGVTPLPQPGNPRPRLFRLSEDRAAINRLGFNNEGAEAVFARVAAAQMGSTPLGVNLAANGASSDPANDFVTLVTRFAPAADFLTIDISCPNSANGQVFLEPTALEKLLAQLNAARDAAPRRPAFFGKLSPDIEDAHLAELVSVMRTAGVEAITVCNTTTARPETLRSPHATERGGLSGAPLFEMANEMLRKVYAMTGGEVPLIGVGGIMRPEDAWTKIRAGASLVQLYTGLVYEGPGLIAAIKRHLADQVERGGYAGIGDAVGAEHR